MTYIHFLDWVDAIMRLSFWILIFILAYVMLSLAGLIEVTQVGNNLAVWWLNHWIMIGY